MPSDARGQSRQPDSSEYAEKVFGYPLSRLRRFGAMPEVYCRGLRCTRQIQPVRAENLDRQVELALLYDGKLDKAAMARGRAN